MRVGDYEVLGLLGRGGMGSVYRARSPEGREVALKVLIKTTRDAVARFGRERRLLDSLDEVAGFVQLLDAGDSSEGPFIVMPLVPGGTLRAKLERGPLGIEETIALGRSLAKTIGAAHERGIVHRDLKPENVLFTAKGRPLVADLGLAKHFARPQDVSRSASLSGAGELRGTVGYMAPEQIESSKDVGPEADVFALGAILYECLAGSAPFAGDTVVETIAQCVRGLHAPLARVRGDVPPWLAKVIERALLATPSKRFADGAALARALEGKETARARRPWLVLPALAALLAVGAVAVVASRRSEQPGETRAARPHDEVHRLILQARAFLGHNEDRRALAALDDAIAIIPSDATALALRGKVRLRLGDVERAIVDLERAVWIDGTETSVYADLGRAYARKGDAGKAHQYFSMAIDDDAGDVEVRLDRAELFNRQGAVNLARADTDAVIQRAPEKGRAWTLRAFARMHNGEAAAAHEDAEKAVLLDGDNALAWAVRGKIRIDLGRYAEAHSDGARAIELDRKLALGFEVRAASAAFQGLDAGPIIEDANIALELDPTPRPLAWWARGDARLRRGEVDAAIEDLGNALSPGFALPYVTRGLARKKKGDLDGAIADTSEAIKVAPRLVLGAWVTRAEAYEAKRETAKAIADYEKIVEYWPQSQQAGSARRKIAELKRR